MAALHWAQSGTYWGGSVALGWFHLPTEDCRLLPHQPGIFDASSRSAGGGVRGSSVSQALSSRWIGIVRSSIRFSCCSVPGFFLGTSGGGGCEGQGEHRADAGAASASPGHFTGAVFPCLLPAAPAPIPSPPHPEHSQAERFVLEKQAESSAALE